MKVPVSVNFTFFAFSYICPQRNNHSPSAFCKTIKMRRSTTNFASKSMSFCNESFSETRTNFREPRKNNILWNDLRMELTSSLCQTESEDAVIEAKIASPPLLLKRSSTSVIKRRRVETSCGKLSNHVGIPQLYVLEAPNSNSSEEQHTTFKLRKAPSDEHILHALHAAIKLSMDGQDQRL